MCWRGRVVLVTGAGGFIGSHLAEALVQKGAKVRALVHYNALNSYGWLDRSTKRGEVDILAGDICDLESVERAVEGAAVVFHLAALIGIPYSYQAPSSYIRTNIEGTLNVLNACRNARVERMVHTSTSEVYGTARTIPIDEAHPLQGQSPYAASKIGADKMAEAYHLSFGLPVVTLRPFNTFGPRQSGRAVIPAILTQAFSGDVVRLGSLAPTRDFNFVANTVDAFLSAGEAENVDGEVIHIGSGREISIASLVSIVERLLGRSLNVESNDDRVRPAASEVQRLVADSAKAQRLLGWRPKVSFEDGLAATAVWMEHHLALFRSGAYVL